MVKFIHTADIHLGVENYGVYDTTTGIHTRLLDFNASLNFCIDTAIEQQVDFFLFCGDAYKTAHPTPTQQKFLFNAFMRLYHARIPVVIIVGNHDYPISFGRAHALDIFSALPIDGFHVLHKPSVVQLNTGSGPVNIVGIPWPTRTMLTLNKDQLSATRDINNCVAQKIAHIICSFANELDKNIPAVLAGHLSVSEARFSGSEKSPLCGTDVVFLPSQLTHDVFDYIALGHIHRYQLIKNQSAPIVYAGSLDRIDFSERTEDKGFCLVTIHKKHDVQCKHIKTPTRQFIQIELHIQDGQDHTQQVLQALNKHNLAGAIIKIIYILTGTEKDTVDVARIQEACASAHYIAGIVPIRPAYSRERRIAANIDMTAETLLREYFTQKKDLCETPETLVQKTLQLLQTVDITHNE